MIELLLFIAYVIRLYEWIIIAVVIMSWLISFNVINLYNPMVRAIFEALKAVTEPFLRPIRRFLNRALPDLRGIDISPIVLLLICLFIRWVIITNLIRAVA